MKLDQYFTPVKIAEELWFRFFNDVTGPVIEPSCGSGNFLKAIPSNIHVDAVEIDPDLAGIASQTGRNVITGDFRSVPLPMDQYQAAIGNPPFKTLIIKSFLDRIHKLLPQEGRCGMILPCYCYNYASTVLDWLGFWSLNVMILPRGIFTGLQEELCFTLFTKDNKRFYSGLLLHEEWQGISSMRKEYHAHTWKQSIEKTLRYLGGEARLDIIYASLQDPRKETNKFWKEKVRQILQIHFHQTAPATYSLNP